MKRYRIHLDGTYLISEKLLKEIRVLSMLGSTISQIDRYLFRKYEGCEDAILWCSSYNCVNCSEIGVYTCPIKKAEEVKL